jgi:hypothetical protein
MKQTLFLVLLTGLMLAACQDQAPPTPATPTPNAQQLELQAAAAAWQAHGIDDYTAKIRYRHPGWNTQEFQVRVENGTPTVEEQSCIPERNCPLHDVDSARLTVDNVLTEALAAAATGQVDHLVYHETYNFPRIVAMEPGADVDSWEISNFQPGE